MEVIGPAIASLAFEPWRGFGTGDEIENSQSEDGTAVHGPKEHIKLAGQERSGLEFSTMVALIVYKIPQ